MKKIVTIGEILVEIMAVDRGEGFTQPMSLVGPFPSGAPAIFIDQAARFGQPCGMVGCVGADHFGRVNLDRLKRDGVDISGIAVDSEYATGSAFVRYRHDGSRDFVFNIKHSASGRMSLTDNARALIDGSDHLHVMGTSLFSPRIVEVVLKAVGMIKAKGGTVSFDPNVRSEMLALPGLREALETILGQCDLFLPSGPELFLFAPGNSEVEAIGQILKKEIKAVVVKNGSQGANYHDLGSTIRQPAFNVHEVDPTGAGDCFGATFVSCWLRGMTPGDALRYAAASGARAVERQGPMEGVSTLAELDTFIADTSAPLIFRSHQ
ncbi:putative sugar kinase, PfkB family protein (plasmid) [Sinorhizobium fredii NGR234]|uniref:Sugar kinase, PfkB family protein n=1 Tax=Sinorhizobium fredii (strain NBRC 101917 / NGR234) TaxID=394 RepID=C3KN09_SINFN|nr:sugar kinase [Sinorhizobium fredii]ACP21582.1 putative sugar kinase, PfkB family protein [Sinorhizobium fredii NGR234]